VQRKAEDFAEKIGEPCPAALDSLMEVIFSGCNRKTILQKAAASACTPEISIVAEYLQVCVNSGGRGCMMFGKVLCTCCVVGCDDKCLRMVVHL